MIRLTSLAALAAFIALASGCGGSLPDSIDVESVNDDSNEKTPLRPRHTMIAGDVLVMEGKVKEDGAETADCVQATSTDPAVVRVRPFRDRECRVFLLEAKSVGRASVSFESRGRTTTTEIEGAPSAP